MTGNGNDLFVLSIPCYVCAHDGSFQYFGSPRRIVVQKKAHCPHSQHYIVPRPWTSERVTFFCRFSVLWSGRNSDAMRWERSNRRASLKAEGPGLGKAVPIRYFDKWLTMWQLPCEELALPFIKSITLQCLHVSDYHRNHQQFREFPPTSQAVAETCWRAFELANHPYRTRRGWLNVRARACSISERTLFCVFSVFWIIAQPIG